MAEKVRTMVLDVDLTCSKCCKKVKKVLCKFPEIREQTYDEKANKVTIKVVCCSPEKIRDKLCCKGRGSITSIEIKEPPKPQPPPPDGQKKKEKPEEPKKLNEEAERQPITIELGLELELEGKAVKPLVPVPVPSEVCCAECYSGRPGGPCWGGDRFLYNGRPVYDCWGGYGYRSVCGYYCFTEEYQQGCKIM